MNETCEALHVINKHAKKHAANSQEYYQTGYGAAAKYESLRKNALYSLKTRVLKHLYDRNTHDHIERHHIHNTPHYCFYIGKWSYHVPENTWPGPPIKTYELRRETTLTEFNPSLEPETDLTIENALQTLATTIGPECNANTHLTRTTVTDQYATLNVEWDCIPAKNTTQHYTVTKR